MHTTSDAAFALQERAPGRLLHLVGRLDVSAATDARLALAAAVDAGQGDLVLDLTGLQAVDATGLGVLVGAHRRAVRQGRTLVLHDAPAPVARVLRLTRLDRVLRQTRSTAVA
ncbi:hypothetical protein BH24ACT10_BH24ACT10_08780 [soil metagenome]